MYVRTYATGGRASRRKARVFSAQAPDLARDGAAGLERNPERQQARVPTLPAVLADPTALLASLLIGVAGFALFVYGRKQQRFPQLLVGLALMIYPYFIDGALLMTGIAAALLALLWGATRLGW